MAYIVALMRADAESASKANEERFESDLFIHDRALWTTVYHVPEEQPEDAVEWIGRDSPEEFAELMGELQQMGLLV